MQQFINDIEKFWQPYLISQLFSVIILAIAFKRTRWARWLFSLMFLSASIANAYTSFNDATAYSSYAGMAIPLYRDFINGWFGRHQQLIVPAIAAGQLLLAIGMLLEGWWVKWACIGAIVFLLAIAPLLVGAAFPFSLTVSVAAWLILKNDDRNYLWKRRAQNDQPNR